MRSRSRRSNRPRRLAILLGLMLTSVSAAHAQVSLKDLEDQLAQSRRALSAPALSTQSRLEALIRCDDLQKRLIAAAPADDRVPTWLADRAACALDLAGENGADIAILFGVPTPAQVRTVQTRAREALELAGRADQAASQVVARLEAQLVNRVVGAQPRPDPAAIEAALHTLVDIEQAQRIPYIKAMAGLLRAAAATDPASRESIHAAARELGSLLATPGIENARRVALGAALIHASIGSPERAAEALQAAVAQFAPVAEAYAPGAQTPDAATALKARLGLIRTGQDIRPRPRSSDAATEHQIDLLEAEARAASLLDRATRERDGRVLLQSAAIRALADADPPPAGEPMTGRTLEKLAAATPSGVGLERLPPEASLAWAIVRVREASPGDTPARNEAIAALTRLADRSDAAASLRTQARWERAVLVAVSGDALAEIDAVALVFRSDPESAKAVPAARRVFDLFARHQSAAAASADAIASLPPPWRDRLPILRESLALLIRRDAPSAERWSQESVRLTVHELAAANSIDALDRALQLVDAGVPREHRPAAAASVSDAVWRTLDKRRSSAALREERADLPGARTEWSALAAPAERSLAWSREHDPDREPAFALLLGETFAGTGDARALPILAPLSGSALDRTDSLLWTRLRFALARAQRTAADHPKAIAALREIADRFEGAPGSPPAEPAYWAAWAEILSILQSQNQGGLRSPDLRVQIKRLELLDPKLGGPPHADRIRQVRAAVGE